jgi:tetratricopeptide (TPR) repeat protein
MNLQQSVAAGGSESPATAMKDEWWLSSTVAADLVEEFADAWGRGECPSVEQFLADLAPGDVDEETAVRLIYEEMCLRRAAGRAMSSAEVSRRFPQWRSKLERLLDCERLLSPPAAASGFPEVGDEVGPFRLLSELGRGALGRVFLAAQPALSDRPVVVKITPQRGAEHLSLARLQHTGIVPLYLAQDLAERRLRLLCMPYLGGVTLARLLDALAANGGAGSGNDVAKVVEKASRDEPSPGAHHGPALQFLQRASYVQAVCWIGACLADALHYAHQRGLAHFDLKPSNILVAGDGQPMLLDFHLARGPLRPGEQHAWLGGTPGYMSPEQEAALAALRAGLPIPGGVDHRSDIYALGVLLDEMRRTGKSKQAPRLEAIVRKCLARSPDDRPHDAAELALELRRALAEGNGERTAAAPASDRARAPVTLAMFAVVLAAGIWGSVEAFRLRQANAALTAKEQEIKTHADRERALRLVANLHAVTDRLRWLAIENADRGAAGLEAKCRPVWQRRRQFLEAAELLDARRQTQVREDLLELAILGAESKGDLSGQESPKRNGAAILAEAEKEFGRTPLLSCLLQSSAPSEIADEIPRVQSAWEFHALGRALVRAGQFDRGYDVLRHGATQFPGDLWLQFSLGRSALQLSKHEEALAAFSACVALAPNRPEPRRRRAEVYRELGRDDMAALDEQAARRLSETESR